MSELIALFTAFFQIGLFSFGGGLAAMPFIQEQTVEIHGWLTMGEFTDLVTLAEMTPGPIAINAATFVGTRVSGVAGALMATFGCILPACIIISILTFIYFRYRSLSVMQGVLEGLRPAIVALITSACISITVMALWGAEGFSPDLSAIQWPSVILFAVALIILRWKKVSPIPVMLSCGVIGGIVYYLIG